MTICEREPSAVAAIDIPENVQRTLLVAAGACTDSMTPDHIERSAMSYGDPASARRMTKIVAAARAQSAKVIGITGARAGIGVSVASRDLANAFASFAAPTLLADVSRAAVGGQSTGEPGAGASLLEMATEVRPQLAVVSFGGEAGQLSVSEGELRGGIAEAVAQGYTVILDLPPVLEAAGGPTASLVAMSGVCDLVFLVSLSGEMKHKELAACVETSRTIGLKLGGLILNDWRMPASSLIES
jgi:Mrp family chromosome partitioning ATPase